MDQEEALKPVIELLNRLKIPYMLVGAIAVNYYSVPRFTHDADIVIQLQPEDIDDLCKSLENKYYVDRKMIENAINICGQFNLIHHNTGFKIDFWVLKKDDFSHLQFSRRIAGKIFDLDVFIISPEDLILTKLSWFKQSDVEKHFLVPFQVIQVPFQLALKRHGALALTHKSALNGYLPPFYKDLKEPMLLETALDAIGIYRMQKDELDKNYIFVLARELNLTKILQDLEKEL